MRDMTHSRAGHDSFTRVTWLIHMGSLSAPVADVTDAGHTPMCAWRDSFTRVTWLIHMSDMTHVHVWRDSCICDTWVPQSPTWFMRATHVRVGHDSFMCVTWLIYMSDMTYSHVTWLLHMWYLSAPVADVIYASNTRAWDMTHSCLWRDSFTWVTWLTRM